MLGKDLDLQAAHKDLKGAQICCANIKLTQNLVSCVQ